MTDFHVSIALDGKPQVFTLDHWRDNEINRLTERKKHTKWWWLIMPEDDCPKGNRHETIRWSK